MFFPGRNPDLSVAAEVIPDWEIVTAAEDYAASLDTLKVFLNIPLEDTWFDAEKAFLLTTAQRVIENHCQLVIMRSTWVGNLSAFYDRIRINKRPFNGVTKMEYVDKVTGVVTTVDPSLYVTARTPQKAGMVTRGDGLAWPDAATRWDGVRITVDAGWDQANLPVEIAHAVLLTTAALDKSRADDNSGGGMGRSVFAMKHQQAPSIIPSEAKALLAPWVYRTVSLI